MPFQIRIQVEEVTGKRRDAKRLKKKLRSKWVRNGNGRVAVFPTRGKARRFVRNHVTCCQPGSNMWEKAPGTDPEIIEVQTGVETCES